MKKIIITDRIRQQVGFDVYPDSDDIQAFTAYSNEGVLNLHRKNKVDLIISELYGAGMSALQLCSVIREDPQLRNVSVIICCRDNEIELHQSGLCRANAVLTLPLRSSLLHRTVQQLLAIPVRAFYRIPFSARGARPSARSSFECELENISVTGMLILAKAELNQGDRINCSLTLPQVGSFEAQAEVVRNVRTAADWSQYGLQFSRLEPQVRRAIEAIVQQKVHIDASSPMIRQSVQGNKREITVDTETVSFS